MKQTTKNILNILSQPAISEYYSTLKNTLPTHAFQETTIIESYDDFVSVSDLIRSTINNGIFDKISFTKRQQIWSIISALHQQLNHCKNYSFNSSNNHLINSANSVIQHTSNLVDLIETMNLYARSIGLENYKEEVKKLSDTRNKYQKIINEMSNLNKLSADIHKIYEDINSLKNNVKELKIEAENKVALIGDAKTEVEKARIILNDTKEKIKLDEQDIETKKLGINSFAKNIEEYKTSIENLESKANYVINKKNEIDTIIQEAEKALNLNSAIGISAAFSSQYHTANQQASFKIGKISFNLWIIGAGIFILVAIAITVLAAAGYLNATEDYSTIISSILARIVAVVFSIMGATFCAKQYIKQKNIAEDYAYKAVLSKSIVAFADEIKKKDEKNLTEYLTKVLDEIHQDPLRSRDNKEETNFGLTPEIIKSLIEKIGLK